MNGKWDHSTKPSTYKLLDKDGKVFYSGSFKDCMNKNRDMHENINSDVYYTRGYNKGYADAQESLSIKMSQSVSEQCESSYDQGLKDCKRILLDKLNNMIDGCRLQDEYGFKKVREQLFYDEL